MRTKDDNRFGVIIDFVNEYFESYGRSPSTREIESGTKISRPTVQRYLKTLQDRGEIEYDGHRGIITQYMRELTETNRVEMGNSIPCGALDEVTMRSWSTFVFLLRSRAVEISFCSAQEVNR